MNNIRLYIEDKEIELDEKVQFAINKQFEDINNPTTIINDYSKTINIPFSQNNNEVFGKIFSPDRVIVGGLTGNTGLAFDPYRKLDFRLEWNETILMQGYAKLMNVIYEKGIGHYEVNLNGELGKLFQEFKKITFVYDADSSNYWIDTKDYFVEEMNKELVYNSWNTAGQQTMSLEKQYIWLVDPETGEVVKSKNPDYHFTDICGFTPSNTFDDNFKFDTVQYSNIATRTLQDYLELTQFQTKTGYNPDTIIGDGLLPRCIGEFRSYHQQPFIYFNKLFKMFQVKAQDLTGYTFSLDSSWFGNENPYWRMSAMALNKITSSTTNEKQDSNNDYICAATLNSKVWQINDDFSTVHNTSLTPSQIVNEDVSICCDLSIPVSQRFYNMPDSSNAITGLVFKYNIPMQIQTSLSGALGDTNRIEKDQGLYFEIDVTAGKKDGSTGIIDSSTMTYKYLIVDEDTSVGAMADVQKIYITEVNDVGSTDYNINIQLNTFVKSTYERIKFNFRFNWLKSTYPLDNTSYKNFIQWLVKADGITNNVTVLQYIPRSYYNFSLVDLWDNTYSIFDIILRYCKMFRILISVDHVNKIVYFTQQKEYFSNYTVEDWTDKLDMSKQWKLTPVHWDYKYINFNYEDDETKIGEEYRDNYGVNYGDYKLKTMYNFNDETNDLFENCKTSIVNTDNVLSFKNLFVNGKIAYSYSSTEEFVYSKDSDGKYVKNFGSFYFYNGLKNFDDTSVLQLLPARISDDTDLQISNNTYCYSDGLNDVSTSKYLSLQNYTMKNWVNYLSLFNKPSEYYTKTDHFTNSVSIYEAFWQKYIEERYNIQNKALIAYFKITPRDFAEFKFNKFVTINNQLYFVNKILDFDMTTNESTKCELITVQDPANYYENNY